MNVPNILTLSRLGLAVILMVLLAMTFPFAKSLALLIFIIAGITDYFDGYLARNVYGTTAFGSLMDPLTDKILVCAAFVGFVELKLVPGWIAVVIIAREFLVTGLRLLAANKGEIIPAGKWGKHKTAWQIIAISTILLGLAVRHDILGKASATVQKNYDFAFEWIALGIGVAVAVVTLASGWMYFLEHRDLIASGRS